MAVPVKECIRLGHNLVAQKFEVIGFLIRDKSKLYRFLVRNKKKFSVSYYKEEETILGSEEMSFKISLPPGRWFEFQKVFKEEFPDYDFELGSQTAN